MKKLSTYAQDMARAAAHQNTDDTLEKAANRRVSSRERFVLADQLELSGTSFFPERVNEKGKIVPAVYSGWHEDELFRLLGPDAVALNDIAPAWNENKVKHVERGGQIVIVGTKPGKSCRWQEPDYEKGEDFMPSYSLNAGHLTGEVDIEGATPVTFTRKASNG